MTKDVFVSISGMHEEIAETPAVERDEAEAIEVVTPGSYYFRNEKHYIVYDEAVEGSSEMIRNRIKITGNGCVEIVKSGLSDSHMIFEKNKKNSTYYRTPYGQMLLDVNTRELEIQVTEDEIDVRGIWIDKLTAARLLFGQRFNNTVTDRLPSSLLPIQ